MTMTLKEIINAKLLGTGSSGGIPQEDIDAALAALAEKGVAVPDDATSADLDDLIASIETGGGFPNTMIWTKVRSAPVLDNNFDYGGGKWLSVNGKTVFLSNDGRTWESITTDVANMKQVVYGDGVWVVFCENTGLFYSTDYGASWSPSNVTGAVTTANIGYSHGMFFARARVGGVDNAYCSADGQTWSNIADNKPVLTYGAPVHIRGRWISRYISSGILVYSTDGLNWISVDTGLTGYGTVSVFNNYLFTSVSNQVYYSADYGETWAAVPDCPVTIISATGTNRMLGEDGTDWYYTLDGFNWTPINLSLTGTYYARYTNPVFFLYSSTKYEIYYSVDAVNWNKAEYPTGNYYMGNNPLTDGKTIVGVFNSQNTSSRYILCYSPIFE